MLVRVWGVVVVRVCGCALQSHGRARALCRVRRQDLNTPLRAQGGEGVGAVYGRALSDVRFYVMGAGRKGGVAVSMLVVFSFGAVGRDFRGP